MRSWRSALACVLLTACGTGFVPDADQKPKLPDPPSDCTDTYVGYANFAQPFAVDWCRGCHGSQVPEGMRQDAPLDVNFDTLADLREYGGQILTRATGLTPTMPPVGGPQTEERALLAEWITCGMRE